MVLVCEPFPAALAHLRQRFRADDCVAKNLAHWTRPFLAFSASFSASKIKRKRRMISRCAGVTVFIGQTPIPAPTSANAQSVQPDESAQSLLVTVPLQRSK